VTEEGDEFVDARRPLFSDYFRAAGGEGGIRTPLLKKTLINMGF
jgi:hypothetical protein